MSPQCVWCCGRSDRTVHLTQTWKSCYDFNVHPFSLITYVYFFPPTCTMRCMFSYIRCEDPLVIKVGMLAWVFGSGNADPDGKMHKHHYVLLQSFYQQMKYLMWALSALTIIMMGCVFEHGIPHAPAYAMYFCTQKYSCSTCSIHYDERGSKDSRVWHHCFCTWYIIYKIHIIKG